MDLSSIDSKIDQLNLEWQEYDFGDTLYVQIPTILLLKNINIGNDFETQKYRVQFHPDGNALIFKEAKQVSIVEKIGKMISEINAILYKQEEKMIQPESQSVDNTNYELY